MVKRESVGIMNPSPGAQYAVLRSPSKRKGKAGRHIRGTQKCESGVNIENNLLKYRKNIACLQCNTDLKLELKGMKPRRNEQFQ